MSKIYAVGIGPGNLNLMTLQAVETIRRCTVIVGYQLYLDQIASLTAGKKLVPGAMLQEVDRCRQALDLALAGETVAVVSSGDAGVYGMAGLLLELATATPYQDVEIEVVPGITAALSCAALVGAPLMNDFAVISLSDLMTDRAAIEKRLLAVAAADLPTALYNPASKKRRELLAFAVTAFRNAGGDLPCSLVRDAFRSQQNIIMADLGNFPFEAVQMTTLVLIGNSQTVRRGQQFFCRRGYQEKYGTGQ